MIKQSKQVVESEVASIVTELVNRCDKTQSRISEEIGLSAKSNALTVFKQGRSPLPINRCVPLAKSCGVTIAETKQLIAACLRENYPEVDEALSYLGKTTLSPSESIIIDVVREAVSEKRDERYKELKKEGYIIEDTGETKKRGRQYKELTIDPLPYLFVDDRNSKQLKAHVQNYMIVDPDLKKYKARIDDLNK